MLNPKTRSCTPEELFRVPVISTVTSTSSSAKPQQKPVTTYVPEPPETVVPVPNKESAGIGPALIIGGVVLIAIAGVYFYNDYQKRKEKEKVESVAKAAIPRNNLWE